jgi:hypothetical protein
MRKRKKLQDEINSVRNLLKMTLHTQVTLFCIFSLMMTSVADFDVDPDPEIHASD